MSLNTSNHAAERIQQRGYRKRDLELIIEHGTATADGYLLRSRDVARADGCLPRAELERLQRLASTFVAFEDDTAVTIMRAKRWRQKKLLRKSALASSRSGNRRRRSTDRRYGSEVAATLRPHSEPEGART